MPMIEGGDNIIYASQCQRKKVNVHKAHKHTKTSSLGSTEYFYPGIMVQAADEMDLANRLLETAQEMKSSALKRLQSLEKVHLEQMIKIKTSREELARAQENVKVAESFLKKIEDKYRVIAIDDSPCPPAESQTAPRTPMGNEVSAGKISSVYHTPAPTPRLNSQPHIIGAPITLRF